MEEGAALINASREWLDANRWVQWVFSGIGVAVFGAVVAVFTSHWFFKRLKSTFSSLGAGQHTSSESESRAKRNRQRMLERVRSFWIDGVLNKPLYQIARIELGVVEQPDAIEHPWKLVAQQPERAPQPLPNGTCGSRKLIGGTIDGRWTHWGVTWTTVNASGW